MAKCKQCKVNLAFLGSSFCEKCLEAAAKSLKQKLKTYAATGPQTYASGVYHHYIAVLSPENYYPPYCIYEYRGVDYERHEMAVRRLEIGIENGDIQRARVLTYEHRCDPRHCPPAMYNGGDA